MKKLLFSFVMLLVPMAMIAQNDNALAFDNLDDYVYAPGTSALISGSTSMSVSMWVYPQNTVPVYPDLEGFAGFRNNTDADFYILQLSPNGIEARFRNSSGIAYDIVFTGLLLNTWQHFTMTLNGSTLTLYHNGIFAGAATVSGSINAPSESFYLGMLPWTGANFHLNGKLDEVSLWNKALTLSEIACVMDGGVDPSDNDLLLYYKCNQGTAGGNNSSVTSLLDSKGNVNGILTGFALNGSNSNFVSGIATPASISITDTICPGATYQFGSQVLTSPGTYYEVYSNSSGCDSVVQLTLTSPVINTSVSQSGPVLLSQQSGAAYQWIDCLNGNIAITGAVSQSYVATANGQYAVVVTMGGCSDTSVCINVTGVGLTESHSPDVYIGPNPFTNQLTVSGNESRNNTLTVYDIYGKIIWQSKTNDEKSWNIDTHNWARGVYFLTSLNHRVNIKLVKL